MAQTGDDCYFFYYQSCVKGAACPFRHVEEARANEVTCEDWRRQQCQTVPCFLRHMEMQKKAKAPCYYERQPSGCTKPNCPFLHKFKTQAQPLTAPSSTVAPKPAPTSVPVQTIAPHAPNTAAVPAASGWSQPPPVWPGAHIPPPPQMFGGPPPGSLGSGYPPFQPPSVPMSKSSYFPPPIDPVIINPNDESSDQDSTKGSPRKPVSRQVLPSSSTKSDNPLDYFLNAKPWVDPNAPRSQSPPGRSSNFGRKGSVSPSRSISPDNGTRRRSLSAERYGSSMRRRSSSLDRSRSPDWHDRRRFGRRSSRSPPRRRSRSPGRDGRHRDRGLMNRFKLGAQPGPKLEEVKVTGSKIISIKKDDSGKEKSAEEVTTKKEEKTKVKETESSAPEDEVKSLEEIYRERALMSMMEAKRKKILENKRKRWEKVETSRQSESSDKSDKQLNEKGDNTEGTQESSSEDEDVKSEVDLADDIDIELGEGELEPDNTEDSDSADKLESSTGSQILKSDRLPRSRAVVPNKSKGSIKSRLGLKAVQEIEKQAGVTSQSPERNINKRSIKDRLGLKSSVTSDKSERSGVIKLNRSSKAEDVMSRIRLNRKTGDRKNVLMLPQITIRNEIDIEERKAGIKRRLGLLDEEDSNLDSKRDRKKRSLDEELMKLLNEEGANISEDDLELLSKKEKKKLLKKLLVQQGREDEYESFRHKKKKAFKKKKEFIDEDDGRESRRRIKIRDRSEEKEHSDDIDEDTGDIPSEEEIVLEEEVEHSEEPITEENTEDEPPEETESASQVIRDERSEEEILQEKAAKEAKLREALEPKSLDDIRKERALKRAQAGFTSTTNTQNKRKIVIEDEPVTKPIEPPVRVTFNNESVPTSRKLIRLGGRLGEQNENDQPASSNRAARRERKIYVPPTRKNIGETEKPKPEPVKISAGPPRGREVVDYGDMFAKKSTSAEEVTENKKPVKLTVSASESDLAPKRRLGIRPPKVEIKNAEVKTFAEIMAEKKRKRQLAQQGTTPVTFNEDSNPSIEQKSDSSDHQPTVISSNISNKLSISTPVSPQKSVTLTKSASQSSIEQTDSKPTRWKRRKVGNTETSTVTSSQSSTSKSQESTDTVDSQTIAQTQSVQIPVPEVKTSPIVKSSEKIVPTVALPIVKTPVPEPSPPTPKEKKKFSDSLLEFDDDLLNMDDDDLDLDLGDDQDHDALMKEMDELLA